MSEEDQRVPLLQTDESNQVVNNSVKDWLLSLLASCIPKLMNKRTTTEENAPIDELFECPKLDQENVEEYCKSNGYTKQYENGKTKIYCKDLRVGDGTAVLTEYENGFDAQKVKYNYDLYDLSAERIASNKSGLKRSPIVYRFCREGCEGLRTGLQGMKPGGIRRYIVNHPPKNKRPAREVQDYVVFHLQLLEVDKSATCQIQNKTFVRK